MGDDLLNDLELESREMDIAEALSATGVEPQPASKEAKQATTAAVLAMTNSNAMVLLVSRRLAERNFRMWFIGVDSWES